jgi:long-chain acyl-CoA synthetase
MEPSDILLVANGRRITRAEYEDRVARGIAVLRDLGFQAGDTAGVALKNSTQFLEVMAAATSLGGRSVPIATGLKAEEVRYIAHDAGAKVLLFDPDFAEHFSGVDCALSLADYERRLAEAAQATDIPLSKTFNFDLYSSGTTGRPKAVERAIPMSARTAKGPRSSGILDVMGVGGPDNVHLVNGPFYHSAPIGFAIMAFVAGQRVIIREKFDAEACLRTIEQERVTWMTCVPTHFVRILALPEEVLRRYDLSSIKAVKHSAAPCPRGVKERIMDLFPLDTVWEVYGGTETSLSMISPQEWRRKPGSVGKAFPLGTELFILDAEGNKLPPGQPGLIYTRPPYQFRYRGSPELDAQTWRGELCTLGDMGYLDEEGYLFITDRMKDMIISGGANVYPAEVEAVLFNHPAVADAAVIGVPDDHWGERVKAIVEPRGEATEQDIMTFCRAHLAHYKCPTSVDFVEHLPRDANGKLRKRELRNTYWAAAERAV